MTGPITRPDGAVIYPPAECPDCVRLREQVASLAHAAADLRADLARARESERATNAATVAVIARMQRAGIRRERLARWAGTVAADARRA